MIINDKSWNIAQENEIKHHSFNNNEENRYAYIYSNIQENK